MKRMQNWNISTDKVIRGFASYGETSKGWFLGFRVHGVCDVWGNLVNVRFTTASVHDNQQVESLTEGLSGLFVGDAGYLLKQQVFQRLLGRHKRILAASRKNMKRFMTEEQGRLLRNRSMIEMVWGVLKERYGQESHLARNIVGLFRHYCYSLISRILQPVLHPRPLKLSALSAGVLP